MLPACSAGGSAQPSAGTGTSTPTRTSTQPTASFTPTRITIQPGDLIGTSILVLHALQGASRDYIETQVAVFNTENEWGITVYSQPLDSYNTLYEQVNSSFQTGKDQPDLLLTLPEQIWGWQAQDKTVELTSYMQDPMYGFEKTDLADFEPIFWKLAGEGQPVYGLPAQVSAQFLYYNQTWAKELGFSHPPLTATEFRQQVCAANQSFRADADLQNDGYGGWIVNTNPTSMQAWMLAFGGRVVDEKGNYDFSNPGNLKALTFLKKLYDDHCAYISNEPLAYSPFAGRLALFITADLVEVANQQLALDQAKNQDAWTLMPFPGDQSALVAEGPFLTLLDSTPKKQLAAWLFTRWMLSDLVQKGWVQAAGTLPLRISMVSQLTEYEKNHKQWMLAVSYMDDLQVQPRLASWRLGRLVLGDGSAFIFRTDLDTARIPEVLAQMGTTVNPLPTPTP